MKRHIYQLFDSWSSLCGRFLLFALLTVAMFLVEGSGLLAQEHPQTIVLRQYHGINTGLGNPFNKKGVEVRDGWKNSTGITGFIDKSGKVVYKLLNTNDFKNSLL